MPPKTLNTHASKRLPWKLIQMCVCVFKLGPRRQKAVITTKKHGLSETSVESELISINARTKNIVQVTN
jgi:hypothetical protein